MLLNEKSRGRIVSQYAVFYLYEYTQTHADILLSSFEKEGYL